MVVVICYHCGMPNDNSNRSTCVYCGRGLPMGPDRATAEKFMKDGERRR